MPALEVINAIPFYTRVWISRLVNNVIDAGMDGAANYISEHGMDTYWDDEAGQNVASVEAGWHLYDLGGR